MLFGGGSVGGWGGALQGLGGQEGGTGRQAGAPELFLTRMGVRGNGLGGQVVREW